MHLSGVPQPEDSNEDAGHTNLDGAEGYIVHRTEPRNTFPDISVVGDESLEYRRSYQTTSELLVLSTSTEDEDTAISDHTSPQSKVRTRYASGPAEKITDPSLFRRGVRAHRLVLGCKSDGGKELFFPCFRTQSSEFFSVGKVFMTLWYDMAGTSSTVVSAIEIGTDPDVGRVWSKVRRFVVVRANEGFCSALPITSYGGQGVAKAGVKKAEHGIIFTGKVPPIADSDEEPLRGESAMRHRPIRVVADRPTEKLDIKARVNFGKVYTVEHRIKAHSFGQVHPDSMEALVSQFSNVITSGSATTRHDERYSRRDSASCGASEGTQSSTGDD